MKDKLDSKIWMFLEFEQEWTPEIINWQWFRELLLLTYAINNDLTELVDTLGVDNLERMENEDNNESSSSKIDEEDSAKLA